MPGRFENKVVVVTGGTSGIGLATATAFAREGASVIITGRRQEALDAAVRAIGDRLTAVRADMASLADIDRFYDAIRQEHAQIDALFANAGGGEFAPLGAITEEHFDRTFDTNVKGVLFPVQSAAAAQGRRCGRAQRLHHEHLWHAGVQRLFGFEGRGAQLRAQLDPRP